MNKKLILLATLLFSGKILLAQVVESEAIDWSNLGAFSSKSFAFKSDQLNYECKDCRYVELKTNSGVSGYFLLGNATFSIPKKKIEGRSTAVMIRLNPKDSINFLQITNSAGINDKGFNAVSLLILNSIFKRCFHSGMDALIPNKGVYVLDMFSDKDGDIMVSNLEQELKIFNINSKTYQ